ncbi:hypothetical protein A9P82_09280 [Arachidicoccus ginsenosidimutans]|nr:hypothetical protein A9P82_09280 [Arachidicoccus sp. BS20]
MVTGLFFTTLSFAQQAGNNHQFSKFPQQKNGIISGIVLDSATKQPVESATVFVFTEVKDSASGSTKKLLAGNAVSKKDGKFEISNLTSPAKLNIQISVVGKETFERTVVLTRANNEQNIGNILLQSTEGNLKTVVVNGTATKPFFEMGTDRKIFNVSQSLVSTGQTAQEVMAQIPSVNVDIDGNVTVRGAAPQIYVDGMPTQLTLDQIPSDLIDKVELITNPSAKFDASTGGGGIINIVLKKNNTTGYNGGLNAGSDTRGSYNFGGDLNVRMGKWNIFATANHRSRNSKQTSHSERDFYDNGMPTGNSIYQRSDDNKNTGSFTFANLGAKYSFNKSNNVTLSGNYVKGTFDGNNPQLIDSIFADEPEVYGNLLSKSSFGFKNFQGDFKYQHNFSKDGDHNILFDVNYSHATSHNFTSTTSSTFTDPDFQNQYLPDVLRNITGNGPHKNLVFQADYANPITKNTKLEAGIRGQIEQVASTSLQYTDSTGTATNLISDEYLDPLASSKYSYKNQVYAAYGIFSSKVGEKLSYELGMRVESSNYKGTQYTIPANVATPFKVKYGAELFPSAFATYNLTDKQNLQANYSRKVNRPNFFQLLPVYNYSDPYNIQVGNPDLKPEFTSMYELSYDNSYGNRSNFMASAYYRHSSDLIVSYQYKQGDTFLNTYANAASSQTYGLELTDMMTIAKIWDMNANFNLFNSLIKNIDSTGGGQNQRVSWFAKMNNNIKLPAGFTFELSGQYNAKTVLPNNSGNGHGWGNSNIGTAQGYIASHFDVDAAIKKDWKWGKGNTLSFTAAISDIFATNKTESYSVTSYMVQNNYRLRQPRVVRFTLSYRFGKLDTNLFKKRNNQQPQDNGGDDGGFMGI